MGLLGNVVISLILFWPILESNGAPFLAYVYKPRMAFPIEQSPVDFDFGQTNGKDNKFSNSSKNLNHNHHIEKEINAMTKEISDMTGTKEMFNALSNFLRLVRL